MEEKNYHLSLTLSESEAKKLEENFSAEKIVEIFRDRLLPQIYAQKNQPDDFYLARFHHGYGRGF